MRFAALIALVFVAGCSHGPLRGPSSGQVEHVVILATNDLHGALEGDRATNAKGQVTQAGGLLALSGYVEALRKEYGENLLWLDAGDQYQGSFESNSEEGLPVMNALNAAGLTAAVIGNHEFDYGPVGPDNHPLSPDKRGALKARMQGAQFKYIASNVVLKSSQQLPDFPNTFTSTIVNAGQARIGVIGLSTLQTPQTTLAIWVDDLEFTDLKSATEREAKRLRQEGADAVVVVGHVGISCQAGAAGVAAQLRTAKTVQGNCGSDDEFVTLLNSLAPGTVDAAIGGHTHSLAYHFVAGVPVTQAAKRGKYFNLIHLDVDTKAKAVITAQTAIEGPVPTCFELYGAPDCNKGPASGWNGVTTQPQFHGKSVSPSAGVKVVIAPVLAKYAQIKAQVVGQILEPLAMASGDSPLGDLLADAMRLAAGTDFAIVNDAQVRVKDYPKGPLHFGLVYDTLPFDNTIVKLTVTGLELKSIITNAENGEVGYFPVSGLKVSVDDQTSDFVDRNQNGKADPGEANRVRSAEILLPDGKTAPILDAQKYTVAISDFMFGGGDFMGWSMDLIKKDMSRVDQLSGGLVRDAFLKHIAELTQAEGGVKAPEGGRVSF